MNEARRREAVFALGLFLMAFAVRLLAARTLAAEPVWDGQYYDFGARHLASGYGYAEGRLEAGQLVWHPWCHYPVGYSAFLGVFYKLFGASHLVAHAANALVGALLAVVTWLLAREALSTRRARIAGVLVALHPGLVLYSALLMTEPLSALLVLGSFWVTLRLGRAPRLGVLGGIAAGALVLGLAVLVRPQALLCAPFLALVLLRLPHTPEPTGLRVRRWATAVGLACAVTLLPVLPWTARNCRVMDSCALVSTNAGWNLAIGAFPRATGRFETLRSEDGCREVTGQVQQDRCWLDYGIANIESAPWRWLSFVPAKLAFTFDHESFAVEYLHEARPAAWPEDRRVRWREVLTTVHRVLLAASVLAFVALVRSKAPSTEALRLARMVQAALLLAAAVATYLAFDAGTPTFWPIAIAVCILPWLPLPGRPETPPALLMAVSLVASTVLTHAVFFGEDRYHVVATPVLCLLVASALRSPREMVGAKLLPIERKLD